MVSKMVLEGRLVIIYGWEFWDAVVTDKKSSMILDELIEDEEDREYVDYVGSDVITWGPYDEKSGSKIGSLYSILKNLAGKRVRIVIEVM